ncbi:MAG: Type 1 glutamine amidotransferase-like domain-containing protein [Ignavibacteriaceae bacterium]
MANDQATYDEIKTARGVFLRGGDQYEYIRLWKGTKTEQAIKEVFESGGVVSGTSAGAMVLGEFDFTARYTSLTSGQALSNPVSSNVDIEPNFLNLIPNALFDTHFIERGRFGRLIASVFKTKVINNISILGVGIDDRTAICIDSTGIATVYGSGAVSFFSIDNSTRFVNESKYLIENIKCDLLTTNWKYDFKNNSVYFIPPTAKEIDTSRLWQLPQAGLFLSGSNSVSGNTTYNLPGFLQKANMSKTVIITHPGHLFSITPLRDFLTLNNISFEVFPLDISLMNDPFLSNSIENGTAFIFAGDSLNLLSLLNTTSSLCSTAFSKAVRNNGANIFLLGDAGKTAGEYFVGNTDTDLYAGYRGEMTNNQSLNLFGDLIFQPRVFENSNFFENRVSAVLWGLMLNHKRLGIYLDGNDLMYINNQNLSLSGTGSLPFLIIDASRTTMGDSSVYRAGGSVGTRQIVAMNNLRYSISNNINIDYSITNKKFNLVSGTGSGISGNTEFSISGNYPNPFNSSTRVDYYLPYDSELYVKIYSLTGKVIFSETFYQFPGHHSYNLELTKIKGIASGVYFLTVSTQSCGRSNPLKIVYLK